jgi:hypothetical protein
VGVIVGDQAPACSSHPGEAGHWVVVKQADRSVGRLAVAILQSERLTGSGCHDHLRVLMISLSMPPSPDPLSRCSVDDQRGPVLAEPRETFGPIPRRTRRTD